MLRPVVIEGEYTKFLFKLDGYHLEYEFVVQSNEKEVRLVLEPKLQDHSLLGVIHYSRAFLQLRKEMLEMDRKRCELTPSVKTGTNE